MCTDETDRDVCSDCAHFTHRRYGDGVVHHHCTKYRQRLKWNPDEEGCILGFEIAPPNVPRLDAKFIDELAEAVSIEVERHETGRSVGADKKRRERIRATISRILYGAASEETR